MPVRFAVARADSGSDRPPKKVCSGSANRRSLAESFFRCRSESRRAIGERPGSRYLLIGTWQNLPHGKISRTIVHLHGVGLGVLGLSTAKGFKTPCPPPGQFILSPTDVDFDGMKKPIDPLAALLGTRGLNTSTAVRLYTLLIKLFPSNTIRMDWPGSTALSIVLGVSIPKVRAAERALRAARLVEFAKTSKGRYSTSVFVMKAPDPTSNQKQALFRLKQSIKAK